MCRRRKRVFVLGTPKRCYLEQFADGFAVVDVLDDLGEETGHRHHLDLVTHFPLQGDRVSDEHLLDLRPVDPVDGGTGEHAVGGHDPHGKGAALEQEVRRLDDGATGGNLIVDDDGMPALHIADEVGGHCLVVVAVPAFVHHRDRQLENVGEPTKFLGLADIASHQHTVLEIPLCPHPLAEEFGRHELIDWDVEEALDLRGVQVHAEHPIGAGGLQEVGHQTRPDADARLILLVTTRVWEAGQDGGDATGRSTLERVDHEEGLHEAVIDRRCHRLNDEHIPVTDIFVDPRHQVPVGEFDGFALAHRQPEVFTDRAREFGMATTREDRDVTEARHRFLHEKNN